MQIFDFIKEKFKLGFYSYKILTSSPRFNFLQDFFQVPIRSLYNNDNVIGRGTV